MLRHHILFGILIKILTDGFLVNAIFKPIKSGARTSTINELI
jgi:hypothetical protein